jgi:hypothetical protein
MSILIIIVSHEMNVKNIGNIKLLNDFMSKTNKQVDYCGISNQDDFKNFENVISFKYKIINKKLQFSKLCDFITDNIQTLNYTWYIKIRPDIKLLEPLDFNNFEKNSVNARARIYAGPKKIKYGTSAPYLVVKNCPNDLKYTEIETIVILDDMIYIFDNECIKSGGFRPCPSIFPQGETQFSNILKSRNINLNVIGINVINTKYNWISEDLNLK